MSRWLSWTRPSLTRRLVLTLLLAFALVGAVLLVQSYVEVRQEFSPGPDSALVKAVHVVAASIAPLKEPRDAVMVLRTIQRQSELARQQNHLEGSLLMELWSADGQRLYATGELGALHLNAPKTGQGTQLIQGRLHRVTQAHAGAWLLRFGEPQLADASLLTLLTRELAPSLLLAFPLVLLPIWLAVHQGLKPLRLLSRRLGQRRADDLSALEVDLRYAELQPVLSAFNEVLDKLRDKVARERAFVQDAAHELRTPMAVIAAQAHVLTRAANEADRLQAEGALSEAIQRASHLAQQLLALASLDDTCPVVRQRVDLAQLLQIALAGFEPFATRCGMELALDAPDSLCLESDRVALQSIIQNLVDNALRYGRAGGKVVVTLQSESAHVCLTVADDGPGIPAAEQAHIFDRFVRGAGQQVQGTGLGLAIVRQAAQRLHGKVDIQPGLGGVGVAFEICLPFRDSAL